MIDTLAAFFDNQGSATAAARQLNISVRAVSYRLDRIRALTGYAPTEPTQRFTLEAAVLGAHLLDAWHTSTAWRQHHCPRPVSTPFAWPRRSPKR